VLLVLVDAWSGVFYYLIVMENAKEDVVSLTLGKRDDEFLDPVISCNKKYENNI